MYSFPNLESVCCSMSSSNCCFLTCIQLSQEAGQVVWYSHLFQNSPQFIVIHTVFGYILFFSSLIALFGSFKTMLNKTCGSVHPFPFPSLRGKAFSSSPLSMMLAMGLSYMDWGMFLLCQLCWEVFFFNHKWILTFAKCFLCNHFLNEMFPVEPSFHPWDKSQLSMLYDPLRVLLD